MLIAAEGIDGAGKTPLLDGVAAALEARGRRVLRVRRYMIPEITDLWWRLVDADEVDQARTAALAAADYEVGLRRCVRPALADGAFVLADKYVYSHRVYFGLRGLGSHELDALFGEALVPDLVLHVTVPVETALERLRRLSGKPDLLEAALDHRLGITIGDAFRRYGLGGAPAEMREEHFVEHQRSAAALYPRVLPAEVTAEVDGTMAAEDVRAACLERIDA